MKRFFRPWQQDVAEVACEVAKISATTSVTLLPPTTPSPHRQMALLNPAFLPPTFLPGLELVPMVPLLDMMVPASEVERVCAKRPRPKRFKCAQCGSAFSNKGQLKGHLRIHTGERPFACAHDGCGKRFTRNEELTRHRRIHSGARPFACALCDKRFGRKDHLKKHVRTHARPSHTMAPLPTPMAAHPLIHHLAQFSQLHHLHMNSIGRW